MSEKKKSNKIIDPPLKYLYTAEFEDGTAIEQQHGADKPLLQPNGNRFTDVLFYDKHHSKLIRFHLTDGTDLYTVDLLDGHFEINLIPFRVNETGLAIPRLENFSIIYFQQHSRHFNLQREQIGHDIIYQLGWKAKDTTGEPHKRIIEFD